MNHYLLMTKGPNSPQVHLSLQFCKLRMLQKIPTASPKWNRFKDAVCYFIAKDLQPLDTVDDKGFRHLLHTIEPRYEQPSRKTFNNKIPSSIV